LRWALPLVARNTGHPLFPFQSCTLCFFFSRIPLLETFFVSFSFFRGRTLPPLSVNAPFNFIFSLFFPEIKPPLFYGLSTFIGYSQKSSPLLEVPPFFSLSPSMGTGSRPPFPVGGVLIVGISCGILSFLFPGNNSPRGCSFSGDRSSMIFPFLVDFLLFTSMSPVRRLLKVFLYQGEGGFLFP